MGLSSNQARFLSITARKCDLEHRMQQICNRRLRLSNDLQSAARSYDDKTSDRKLFMKTLNTDSIQTTGDYEAISAANIQKNGYYIMDNQDGNVVGTFASGSVINVTTAAGLAAAVATKPDATIVIQNALDLRGGAFSTITDAFKGKIYANGNTITTDKAIFDNITAGAAIYDMNLVSGGLTGGSKGLLANTNAGTIDNIYVTGSAINAGTQSNVGVIAGTNNGSMSNISSTVSVSNGGSNVGGIVGVNNGGISKVLTTDAVTIAGTTNVGSIAGTNNGAISLATAIGNVTGTSELGAIAGTNAGNISSVFAAGTVGTATSTDVGGIVGTNAASSKISDSYSVATIDGTGTKLGGLAGSNSGSIGVTNVFIASESGDATAAVGTGSSSARIIDSLTSSAIDNILEPTLSSAWTKSATTNVIPTLNGTPVTTTTTTSPATRTETVSQQAGSNFTVLTSNATLSGTDLTMYNKLTSTYGSSINGTDLEIVKYKAAIPDAGNPGQYVYQDIVALSIKTKTGLEEMDTACNSATAATKTGALTSNYVLTNDIALSGTNNWDAIGDSTETFTGKFDGNMHKVSNLNINLTGNATNQGMFGNVGAGGSVLRTNLDNASIATTGDLSYAGSIVGLNNGTIENCNSTNMSVTVGGTSASFIGGLAGTSGPTNANASINKSSVGGVLNLNNSTCYQVGGFSGWLQGGNISFSSADVDIHNVNAIPSGTTGSSAQSNYISVFVSDLNSVADKPIQYCCATGDLTSNSPYLGAVGAPSTANGSTTAWNYSHSCGIDPGSVLTGDTDQHVRSGVTTGDSQSDVAYSSYIKNSSTGTGYAIYDGNPKPTAQTDLSTILNDQVIVNGTPVNVWNSDGTLNSAASNTVIVNYTKTTITGATATASAKAPAHSDYDPTDIYTPGATKNAPTDEELQTGLRSGRYQLLVKSDPMTQSPITTSSTGDMTFEKIDWRTEPIISDELDVSNDKEAQDTYDRVIRDVNEQDKMLQMEQEKVTTEYQALTSEKDAVKKILDTNAQGSFKYFS